MLRATCRLLRVLPSALVLCTVGPVTLAAQAFEGSVTMRVNLGARASAQTGAAATQQLEYQVRGGKVRVNMGGPMGGMAMLAVPQERKLYMLMAAQQAYMEMPLAEAASAASSAPEPDVKVTRTGKKETVAGLSCEHVLVAQGKATPTDICITTELGRYVDPGQVMRAGAVPAWQKQIGDGFPLKVTLPDGTVMMEAISVETKRLSNDLFSVPSNYNKMAVPARRPPA
jgi:hypothetical protein